MHTSTRPTGLNLVAWKLVLRNTLRGFADVRPPIGLTIREVAVHQAPNGKAWASLPSKRDDATGKVRYAAILEWPDRPTAEAVEPQYPGAVLRQAEAAR